MKSTILTSISLAALLVAGSADAAGQRRRVVVVRHPVPARHPITRTRLMVRHGHPIHRVLPANVVVRTAHRTVIVDHPLVYLPTLAWRASVASLPPRERLVWQDSETISRDEEWVDTNYGIDASGDALFLDIDGKAKLNFAEVTFANGNVQVVDFNEKTYNTGVYSLLDFADGRHVATIRILAKSESDDTKLSVYLSK